MTSLHKNYRLADFEDSSEDKEEIASLCSQVMTIKDTLKSLKEKDEQLLNEERAAREEARHEIEVLREQLDKERREHAIELEKISLALRQSPTHDRILQETVEARAASEEVQEHLKLAHQHLSKKVRETTELTEKLQALQSHIEQLNGQMIHKNQSLVYLEKALHEIEERNTLLKCEIQDTKKAFDGKMVEWQNAVSVLKQQLENERKEKESMRVYEERCHQLALHWDNMGKVLWNNRSNENRLQAMVQNQISLSPVREEGTS